MAADPARNPLAGHAAGFEPIDRQIILLYLEDVSAESIGEIVGLSPTNVAVKIHRIKKLLATMFDTPGKS